jgi:3'(2'), 5'-bisphosphate nucleotidase
MIDSRIHGLSIIFLESATKMRTIVLDEIAEIAKKAGERILSIYESGDYQVSVKGDQSPVTRADFEANHLILEGLKLVSDELVISEETVMREGFQAAAGQSFWLVDPLDGTRNFIERKDSFVVSIALIENGEPTIGVIYAPVYDELYTAQKGHGAFFNGVQMKNTRIGSGNLSAFASGHFVSSRAQEFYDKVGITHVTRFGSALKLARIARGDADLYPRLGPTYEWDIAAGHALLKESGCTVIDLQTQKEMTYNKPSFLNRGFVAARSNLNLESVLTEISL